MTRPKASFLLRFSDRLHRRRQAGQGMVEYALILVLVAIVAIVGLTAIGGGASSALSSASNGLTGASGGGGSGPKSPNVHFTTPAPTDAVVGQSYTPNETSASGGAVTWSVPSGSSSVCGLTPGSGTSTLPVTFSEVGTCTIDASVAASSGYTVGTASQNVTVGAATQSISFTSTPPSSAVVDGTYNLPTATVTNTSPGVPEGTPGDPDGVTLSLDASSSGCSVVEGSTWQSGSQSLTFTAPGGTCIIDANQAGDASYTAAAQVQQTITVTAGFYDNFTTPWSDSDGGNGWTVLGTEATIDSGITNNPGLTIRASTPGSDYCPDTWTQETCDLQGVDKTAPAEPFTVTTELQATLATHWQGAMLFVGDADARDVLDETVVQNQQGCASVVTQDVTAPVYNATHDTACATQTAPIYLRLVVNSETDINAYYSYTDNGSDWKHLSSGITNSAFSSSDPITTVGLAVINDSDGAQPAAVFNWVAITTP
jgi:Flp pilus assembly pilin Flp